MTPRRRASRAIGMGLAAVALLLALALPTALRGEPVKALTGTVVEVLDGDTIRVRIGDKLEKVRYIGMSAPELRHPTQGEQPGARAAAEANKKLVAGKTVRLELDVQERDKHGRLWAYVYVGRTMVNAELVGQGYARANTFPPNVKHQDLLRQRQREARRLQRGLWKDAAPAATR